MATLLLIRHGIAEDPRPGQQDADRALTPEGWKRTHLAMQGLVARGYRPHRGFNSPYRRAAETMACLQEAAGGFPLETSLELTPGGRPGQADLWLRSLLAEATPDHVLAIISHEPFLSSLVFQLTGRSLELKKAGCVVVTWDSGSWSFERHFQPMELRS